MFRNESSMIINLRRKKLETRMVRPFIWIMIIFTILFTVAVRPVYAAKSRDIIIILDTSLSMKGQAGGKDIFDRVKKSIEGYIDQVRDGDRVTFVTFDTDVRIYPSVLVDDDNDRDILKKYISMTEATGLWTYTHKMIYKVFEAAKSLEKEADGRQTEIIILTDAIDDPPPGEMKKFDLADFVNKYGKRAETWVYILSFSNIDDSEAAKKLAQNIRQVTDKVEIIKGEEPEKGTQSLIEGEKSRQAESSCIWMAIAIAVACILFVLFILFLIKRFSALKVAGRLEYWNNEIIEPYIQRYDFARNPVREIRVGKGLGCTPNIKDINIKTPFVIKAVREGGQVRMAIEGSQGAAVEMVNRQADGLLQDGDVFKVGNYTFKYFSS